MRHAGRVRLATLARHRCRRWWLAFFVGRDFMPRLDEGAFLLQTMLPAEASLDEVDAANHRVEDVLRALPRGGGRGAPHRPRRAHRGPDAAHGLGRPGGAEAGARALARRAGGGDARGAGEGARRSRCCSPRRWACASTRAWAARPADLSVRIFGPDLDELARLGDRARELMAAIEGIEDLRRRAGRTACRSCGSPSTARRRRAWGSRPARSSAPCASAWWARSSRRCGSASGASTCVLRAQDDRRARRRRRSARLLIDGHDGTKIPLGQLARDRGGLRPGRRPPRGGQPPHRGRGQRVRPRPGQRGRGGPRAAGART